MKNQQLGNSKWIYEKDNNQRELAVLECLSIRGVASFDHILNFTKLSEHPARDAIKFLMSPPAGLPALIRTINVVLPGQRGRSVLAYVLTQDGAISLGDQHRRAPTLTENAETAHALLEMNVYMAAMDAALSADVEKVIPYDHNHLVRIDVLVKDDMVFEIEQNAGVNDIPRITNKLLGYNKFFRSTSHKPVDSEIRVLFALNANDKTTIYHWQHVIDKITQSSGDLSFRIYWQYINKFLEHPTWNDLDRFTLLAPSKPEVGKDSQRTTEPKEKYPPFVQSNTIDLFELNTIMSIYTPIIAKEKNYWTTNRKSLFEMMELIFDGSHYEGGPVLTESIFPVCSLNILYTFLHLHQNKSLLEQLQNGFKKVQSSQSRGIAYFRHCLTQFYWDIFLRYFSFGRNGPLEVWVNVPSFDDDRSDIHTKVRIKNHDVLSGKGFQEYLNLRHAEKAFEWVLDALFLYADDLGLTTSNRGKGKSR